MVVVPYRFNRFLNLQTKAFCCTYKDKKTQTIASDFLKRGNWHAEVRMTQRRKYMQQKR
jgi:hypothetical protein